VRLSTDRILTSHVGSLPRTPEILDAYSRGLDADELEARLQDVVGGVVREQADVGIDLVNDGDYGKPMSDEVDYGAWSTYSYGRLSGFEIQEVDGLPVETGVTSPSSMRQARVPCSHPTKLASEQLWR
jgi:5-methyltetrahydropteroyltriglutamate--homocysteine methyltransferase